MSNLQDILEKWQNDLQFRENLKNHPNETVKILEAAGFKVNSEDLAKIRAMFQVDPSKNEPLDDRISK